MYQGVGTNLRPRPSRDLRFWGERKKKFNHGRQSERGKKNKTMFHILKDDKYVMANTLVRVDGEAVTLFYSFQDGFIDFLLSACLGVFVVGLFCEESLLFAPLFLMNLCLFLLEDFAFFFLCCFYFFSILLLLLLFFFLLLFLLDKDFLSGCSVVGPLTSFFVFESCKAFSLVSSILFGVMRFFVSCF